VTNDICVAPHAKDPDRPRRAVDGLYLCAGHFADLERLIAEMPAVHDDLTRPATPGPKAYGGGGESHGLTVDDQAAELRSQIRRDLRWWAHRAADERGFAKPYADHPYSTASYLLRHLEWLAAQRIVVELLDVMRELRARARGITDLPARRVPLEAPCRMHVDGEPCPGIVNISVRGDEWLAHCPACRGRARETGGRYEPQDATPYVRALSRPGQWISTDGVIRLARMAGVPCSAEVVRQWAHRKKIKGGDGMYDLATVHDYLAKRELVA
jgi:hypothetical protein